MKIKYKITNEILNILFEFSKLNAYFSNLSVNREWANKLTKKCINQSSIASISIDSEMDLVDLLTNVQNETVSFELKESFKKYKEGVFVKNLNIDPINFTVELIDNIHSEILSENEVSNNDFRTKKDKITKIINSEGIYKKVEYDIKTKPSEIKSLLIEFSEWVKNEYRFTNPIILAGIVHHQIVQIHPYEEGNGRLARALIRYVLNMNSIDTNFFIPFEIFFLKNRERYYDVIHFGEKEDDLTEWLTFFSRSLLDGANIAADNLAYISGGTIDIINSKVIMLTPKEVEVVNILSQKNQATGSEIARILKVSRQNINIILNKLIEKKVVTKTGSRTRGRYKLTVN